MTDTKQHIVFAGGGTAGHLFPGLAVAEVLLRARLPVRLTFVGTGKAFEEQRVVAAGYDYLALRCRPFPTRPQEALRFVTDNVSGYYTARRFLREQDVTLVVGLGGYGSAAAVRAAAALRIPYILLEQNVVPGKATRWLAGNAAVVCAAFADVRSYLRPGTRVRITGTPLRQAFLKHPPLATGAAEQPPRRLLVLGGSGGSQSLNENVPWAIHKARAALLGWEVVHQTGERDAGKTADVYRKLAIEAQVSPFFEQMPALLRRSDLVVSRSGGTTLAELAVCGVPAILIPFPRAADDHQRRNADHFVAAGGARLLDGREVEGRLDNALSRLIAELASHDGQRQRMAHNISALARPDATRRVACLIAELANRQSAAAA